MWYIISATNPEQKYVLLANRENVVGRRDCSILVGGDAAVSRKHAVIQLSHPEVAVSRPHKLSLLTLKDVSKFGTWVNKERVKGEAVVKDGDEIYFGSPKSTFLLVNEPYIITTSCLDNASKNAVKEIVRILGGHVVSEWRKDCSLLVMNHISVTIKVICAMVSLKAVVTPRYLEDFVTYLKGEGSQPEAQHYLPPIAESQVNPDSVSFSPDARRTTLFRGMKFIFLSQRQFKKMSLAIELAGGVPVLMEEGTDDNDDEVLAEGGTVVMSCGLDEQQLLSENGKRWVQHVHSYLKKEHKQLIQDSEIGYAVLYSSTERHCNPNIDAAQHLMPLPSQSLSERVIIPSQTAEILVENTEISQQTKRNERCDRTSSVSKQKSLIVSKIKTEPVSQDKIASTGSKSSINSSVCEETELTRSSGIPTVKQGKETPQKASAKMCQQEHFQSSKSPSQKLSLRLQKRPHSSKSPSPEPKAGFRRSGRTSKSPSPEPKTGFRRSVRTSKSPSPEPKAGFRRSGQTSKSPSPEPKTGLQRSVRTSKSPSPEPKTGFRRSVRTSKSPSPEPKAGFRRSGQTSKSPSPEPKTGFRRSVRTSKSPSPEPKTGFRRSVRTSTSPSPEPKTGFRRSGQTSKSPSPIPMDIDDLATSKKSSRSPSPKRRKGKIAETSRSVESARPCGNVTKKNTASTAHGFVSKSSKSAVNLDIVDKSEKSNVISSEPVSSRSKKNISLALFDASDDDDDDADADNVRKSSKSASAAKPRKVSGSAGLFDSSDDDNPSLLSKRAAGVAKSGRQRRSSDLFDVSDDDEVIAASAVSSTSKRKRRHSDPFDDDEETFFQEKETKRKCLVSAEDSEMTSVAVKQEKEDTHAGVSHVVLDSEVQDESTKKLKVKAETEEPEITKRDSRVQSVLSVKPDVENNSLYQTADSSPAVNADVPSGFLTTRKPIKHQVIKSEVYEREPTLPQSVVVTVFVELVKQPTQAKARVQDKDVPDGYIKWKGKLVKNFKKFKKTNHVGCNRLPNIIGGSDLIVHTGSQHKNIEHWFQEAMEAESQQNENDREAQDLFNWEQPSTSRRKHSR